MTDLENEIIKLKERVEFLEKMVDKFLLLYEKQVNFDLRIKKLLKL